MNILIVHQNFPGQFPHIADALVRRGDRVAAIGGTTARGRPGVDLRRWTNPRSTTPGIFEPATRAEADIIRGTAAAKVAEQLRRDGFMPEVIVGHPGWGETLFLKLVWPEAKLILFGEYFYGTEGGDVGFDPEFGTLSPAEMQRVVAKNATQVLAYVLADRIVSPTKFQAGTFPPMLRERIAVLHEGLDLAKAKRRPGARLTVPGGRWPGGKGSGERVLDGGRPVVTFVNRTLEPLRGFHVLMRALPAFLDACPEAEVVLIGQIAAAGYGAPAPGGRTWPAAMVDELGVRLDLARVHFLGPVPHERMIDAFSISAAHVYYTYPFILSWSLVEAMACGCLVIGSDTGPVRDAIEDGVNGVLLDFFDTAALSAALVRAVREPAAFTGMRVAAEATARTRFDRHDGVAGWLALVDATAGGATA